MEYKINGTVMQSLEITLSQGEAIFTESGGMAWMSDGLEMKTSGRGGIGKSLGRMLAGESLFLTTYTCTAPQAMITFTTESPGKVLPVPLREGYSMICQKDAFMCAEDTVDLAMHFRKRLGTGLFGGEGFILQKLTGPGTAFVEIAGEVQMYELQPGQRLRDRPRPNRDVRADLRLRHRDGEGPHRTWIGRRRRAVPGDHHRPRQGLAANIADHQPGGQAAPISAEVGLGPLLLLQHRGGSCDPPRCAPHARLTRYNQARKHAPEQRLVAWNTHRGVTMSAPSTTSATVRATPLLRRWQIALDTCNYPDVHHADVLTRWLVIARACVFSMTITSGVIGVLLALGMGAFAEDTLARIGYALLAVIGLIAAHATNNLVNDWTDVRRGVDTEDYPRAQYSTHPVLGGLTTPARLLQVALALTALDGAIMLLLAWASGPLVIAFAVSGLALSLGYTAFLKRFALGEITALIVWGPLMTGGTVYAIAGELAARRAASDAALRPDRRLGADRQAHDKIESDRPVGVHIPCPC